MSIGDPPPSQGPASPSMPRQRVLTKPAELGLRNERKKKIYKKLKGKPFCHTQALDFQLLQEAGMDRELEMIFNLVGRGIFIILLRMGESCLR